MLQDLRDFLQLPEEKSKDNAWFLDWVAENWHLRAKEIFAKSPKEEQKLCCEIMLVGASPNEDIGIPGFAKIYIAVMKYPNFEPQIIKGGNRLESIGSGSGVEIYKKEIEKLTENSSSSLMQSEVGMPGGYGSILLHCISKIIRENPQEGISKYLHIALIRRGQFALKNNDTIIHYPKGGKIEIKMPPVAKSYNEFLSLTKDINKTAEGAVCVINPKIAKITVR